MSKTQKKFIESHWLTFATKGVISIVAGLCLMYVPKNDVTLLAQIVGWTILGLAIIEMINATYRRTKSHNVGFALFLGLLEMAVSVAILYTVDPKVFGDNDLTWLRIVILASYVAFASIVTIAMGFISLTNATDRMMWIINGMIGCVIACMLFGGTSLGSGAYIALFGTYLMVNGITDLFFGVHSKDEVIQARLARRAARKKGNK